MPLYQAWCVSCDGCGDESLWQLPTREMAREYAIDNDWYVGIDGTVLCPDCDGENE